MTFHEFSLCSLQPQQILQSDPVARPECRTERCLPQLLAEAAGDVSLGAGVRRRGEKLGRGAALDDFSFQKKRGHVADAGGLLHVMGDDDHGAGELQLHHQLLDLGGADGVQRGARLVEEKHFRVHRQGAGDAQALLLAAGKSVGGFVQHVFHFVPEGGAMQAVLDAVSQLAAEAVDAQAVGDIFKNGFRERIGALENHSDAAAQAAPRPCQKYFAVEQHRPLDARVAQGFLHAVESAQEGGLAAAGRPDERGDAVGGNSQTDVEKSLLGAVEKIDLRGGSACVGGRRCPAVAPWFWRGYDYGVTAKSQ